MGLELRKNKDKDKALQGQAHMIKGEQDEGFIYEIVADSHTLAYIKEINDTDLNEATLASPFEEVDSMGARDSNYNVKVYKENSNVWEKGDMDVDTGIDDVHPHPSFLHCSSF